MLFYFSSKLKRFGPLIQIMSPDKFREQVLRDVHDDVVVHTYIKITCVSILGPFIAIFKM